MVDGYLSGQKARLSSPVLIKTVPATTVACMQTRLASYDALFDKMPEMGALMEQAACVFHHGSYRTFSESYEAVLKYVEENGCEIAGEIRESYIDGVWNKEDESQWLSEIQVPIRKKGSEAK